ncbi:MAG TPA: DUF2227 family putative metal-binding protein [Chlamydiales bacterium]|nr:DUF2227 family putative metal-binding protein [Chlamydiales bacterium]
MALYKTHSTFNIFLILPIALAAIWYFLNPDMKYMGVFAGGFIYSTLFMSPDLDLANRYKLFSLRGILTLPFRPYAHFSRHRGMSHNILFGTALRIVWLTLVFLGVSVLCSWDIMGMANCLKKNMPYLFYGVGAIFLADLAHLFLDFVYSKRV